MESICIYRKSKGRGARCTERCCGEYCNSHRRAATELQKIIHNAFGADIHIIDKTTVVPFLFNLYTQDIPQSIIEEAVCYLLTSYDLWNLIRPIAPIHVTSKKAEMARHLHLHVYKMYIISTCPTKMTALCKLQQRWRRVIHNRTATLQGPWPQVQSVNEADPFTLESLLDLPTHTIFSYMDEDGSVFAFHAPELECAVRQGQNVNPFTRQQIPKQDVDRLQRMMRYLPKLSLPFPPDTWKSAHDAFQDVTAEYQRLFGIYLETEWLTCLTEEDVEYVFYTYHIRTQNTSTHMRVSLLRNPPCKPWGEHSYSLAHEMWRMSEDHAHPFHMYWMCMLLLTLTEVSHHMVLPDWVFSIV